MQKKALIWIVIITVISLLIIGLFLLTGDKTNIKYVERHEKYDDGWALIENGESKGNVDLPVQVRTSSYSSVVLSNKLPDSIKEDDAIVSRNYHQILRVTIDGELVFAYPPAEWSGTANLISDEWQLVPLKPEYAGKTIEFTFTNSTAFPFGAYIGDFYYGSDNSLVQYVRHQGFWGVIMGIIISIMAGLLLIVSVIYRKHTMQITNTAMGLALLFFSIWLTNRAKMCLFPDHSIYVYFASVICLMMVAPFIFLYSYYRNKTFRLVALWGFRLCFVADALLIVLCFFINFDIEIIAAFAYILSLIAMILNAHALYQGGFGKASKKKSRIEKLLDRTEFMSNILFISFAIIEIIVYSDMLWTEASMFMRVGALIYSTLYFIFIFWRTFLVVQDRTIVTKKLHDSQLELMMGQIQPHFIFNTLSSIRTLVMVDPKQSYDMLYDFSNYLRANIDNVTNLDGIEFSSEVEHIKSYVNIEKVRFGERLDVEYDINASRFTVPPLSIQPLIENAIKHGVCKKITGGTVKLISYETETHNVVEVRDTGVGFNEISAGRVFYAAEQVDASNKHVMKVIDVLDLIDAEGKPIEIKEPEDAAPDLSGNGSEKHQSTGMLNILLRLKEISNATVEIYSKENEGTQIKVLFPKNDTTPPKNS